MLRKEKKSGQAIVEYALLIPVFIFVFLGIIDFGITMHCWSTLNLQCVQAARAGARRNSQLVARNFITANTHASLQSVVNAFWDNRSPLMATASYEFNSATDVQGVGTNAPTVVVSAKFNVVMWTPLLGGLIGGATGGNGALTLSASAREKKE